MTRASDLMYAPLEDVRDFLMTAEDVTQEELHTSLINVCNRILNIDRGLAQTATRLSAVEKGGSR